MICIGGKAAGVNAFEKTLVVRMTGNMVVIDGSL